MKKIILHSFICAICITLISSCAKEVNAPVKTTVSANTSTGGQTQNTDQSGGHTCGGGNYSYNNGGY